MIFTLFWGQLGRIVQQLLNERAHVEVVVTIKEGKVQFVRTNRTYLPANLPQV